jgi:hypothetical protein
MRKGVLKDDRADRDAAQTVDLRQNDFSRSARINPDPPLGTNWLCRRNCISLQHGRYGSTSPTASRAHMDGELQMQRHQTTGSRRCAPSFVDRSRNEGGGGCVRIKSDGKGSASRRRFANTILTNLTGR